MFLILIISSIMGLFLKVGTTLQNTEREMTFNAATGMNPYM